jgi:hypothetical protein
MKNEKKFKFDAQQADLISQSFNDFKNDAVKAIAANSSVGGRKVPYSKLIIRYKKAGIVETL